MADEDKSFKRFRKHSKLTSASDVLQVLLQNSKTPISGQFLRWKMWSQWPEVVGPTISSQCQPVGFDQGTLLIWVQHPVYIQQLSFLSEQIREKINEFVGRPWVRKIRFTLDRKALPTTEREIGDLKNYLSSEVPSEGEEPPPGPYHPKDQ